MIAALFLFAACNPTAPTHLMSIPRLDDLGAGTFEGRTADAKISVRLSPGGVTAHDAVGEVQLPVAIRATEWTIGCLDTAQTGCPTEAVASSPGIAESWTIEPNRLWHRIRVDSPEAWPVLRAGGTTVQQLSFTTLLLDNVWMYHGLRGWDADGNDLQLRFEVTNGLIQLRTEVKPSSWPVWIDPWLEGTLDQYLGTNQATGLERGGIQRVGDVNHDGIDDAFSNIGTRIYLGTPQGIGETEFAVFNSSQPFTAIPGHNIMGRGENDLLFPCLGAGNAMALHSFDDAGQTQLLQTYPVWYYPDYECWPAVGDFNGDGADDIAAGLVLNRGTRVFYGGPQHSWESYVSVDVESVHSDASIRSTWAANVNGDAFDDLIVSYRGNNEYNPTAEPDEDHVFSVRLGTPEGVGPTGLIVEGRIPNQTAYVHEAFPAGDLNGDALDDIILIDVEGWIWLIPGAQDWNPTPIRQFRALPRCYYLAVDTEGLYPGACSFPYNYRGASIDDVNGDGYGDIAIQALPGHSVVLGGPHGLVPVLYPFQSWTYTSAYPMGDVNGDSLGDFRVATSWIVFGSATPDIDNDGFPNEADCEPYVPDAFPGGAEVLATRFDEDCDGLLLCHGDLDNDGGGDASEVLVPAHPDGCEGAGAFSRADDCAPDDPSLSPANPDLPDDDVDQNCDGTWACYVDLDGDGYGAPEPREVDTPCSQRADLSSNREDCDDDRADVNPAAPDLPASGVDEDCDGLALCATDDDLDGFGTPGSAALSPDGTCDHPGLAATYEDCGPYDPSVFPDAAEVIADELDNNCDGRLECYYDSDLDGVGTEEVARSFVATSCTDLGAWVSPYNDDCDDRNSARHPRLPEIVDNYDNDCDGFALCARDLDGDRRVSPDSPVDLVETINCIDAEGYGMIGDCEPLNPLVRNGLFEVVNAYDDNCDGRLAAYRDNDKDGYGSPSVDELPNQPHLPIGYSIIGGDCDDTNPRFSPGSLDVVGDDLDQDCDGLLTCFRDRDRDRWGGAGTVEIDAAACNRRLSGASDVRGDCADNDASIRPGNPDRSGDGIDADCDGADGLQLDVDPATGTAHIRGAGNGGEVVLVASTLGQGPGPCPRALGGACVDLLSPAQVGTGVADPMGELTLPLTLPVGQAAWYQAWRFGSPGEAAWASPVVAVP